jgi:hypothetical protein
MTAMLPPRIRDRLLHCIKLAQRPGTDGEGDAATYAIGRIVLANASVVMDILTTAAPSSPPPRTADRDEPLPPGEYTFWVINSVIRENSARTGEYLRLTLEGLEGAAIGHEIVDFMNLSNPSAWAVAEGKRRLKEICRAVGVRQMTDTEQLHCKPLTVVVGIQPAKDKWPARNEVRAYKAAVR